MKITKSELKQIIKEEALRAEQDEQEKKKSIYVNVAMFEKIMGKVAEKFKELETKIEEIR